MPPKFSFSPLSASSPPEMKQTQKIKTPIPHGSHVDCSASLTHETDRLAGADSDFVGLCVRQTWVLLVGKTISVPAPAPILSVLVRPPLLTLYHPHPTCPQLRIWGHFRFINTLRTGDADFRLYITTVHDGWHKSAFLTRPWFPRTTHLITQ